MSAKFIQKHPNNHLLKVLFDPGSDITLAHERCLPQHANPRTVKPIHTTGVHANRPLKREVLIHDITLPEFSPTTRIEGPLRARVYSNPDAVYDIILGLDSLIPLGIDVLNSTKTLKWNEHHIPFHPKSYFAEAGTIHRFDSDDPLPNERPMDDISAFFLSEKQKLLAQEAGYKSKIILESKYETATAKQVAEQQLHLNRTQRRQLEQVLNKFSKLFNGKLRKFPHRQVHLELNQTSKPHSCRPYPVPRHHHDVFKAELERLVEIGVL